MKRRSAWISFAACALTVAAPCRASHAARPQAAGVGGVQVIAYANGQTGFFETDTGRLYLYDSALKKCIGVRRVRRLGESLEG